MCACTKSFDFTTSFLSLSTTYLLFDRHLWVEPVPWARGDGGSSMGEGTGAPPLMKPEAALRCVMGGEGRGGEVCDGRGGRGEGEMIDRWYSVCIGVFTFWLTGSLTD